MFCSKCGTQIQDDACFCHKCGSATASNASQSNAYQENNAYQQTNAYQQPNTSYTNAQVKDGVNIVYPDGHNEIGDIYITASEIVFVKKSKGILLAFGRLGNRMEKGEEKLRFNVSDIIGGSKTRIGLNVNVYQITLRSGETYKLCLNHPKTVSYLEGRFG